MADPLADAGLFDVEAPPPVSLADRFVVPPFSILDRRNGHWQDRRRKWLSLGIKSEVGRDEGMGFFADAVKSGAKNVVTDRIAQCGGAVSIFDPVLCELAYRWFSAEGHRVLDPFAGGSVRGVVAGTLMRDYLGIDLRGEQVKANRAQAHLSTGLEPWWVHGDSAKVLRDLDFVYEADLIFTCPPYADLEVYSDDPADLSNMDAGGFAKAYNEIIRLSCERLRPNRFAVWVISDVRDKHGLYRGLVLNTIDAFAAAGLALYNDLIILDPVGTSALLAAGQFEASRKVRRMHQHMLVFVKGDPKQAAVACGARGRKGKAVPILDPEKDMPPPPTPQELEAMREYMAEEEELWP